MQIAWIFVFALLLFGPFVYGDTCQDNNPKTLAGQKSTVISIHGPLDARLITKDVDSCKDSKTLIKFYCDKDESKFRLMHCPKACQQGLCI